MLAGTVYGVILNDQDERARLAEAFAVPPYKAPPEAPVVYIKPRNCFARSGAEVFIGDEDVEVAATLGLLIGRDAVRTAAADALAHVAGVCLALDVTLPHDSYYRPAIPLRCRDGFLPLGDFAAFAPSILTTEIVTAVDGKSVHRWAPARLVRDAATLIADLSAFMTLAAGDVLLIGLPYDAPRVRAGQSVTVTAGSLPALTAQFNAGDVR
jgi:5-oxopent-3-ene-1,2,5-tricarboxylate decarboxylase/2-hydroxyhepta-2,4-diene-1,7-dioate isomerase